MFCKAHILSCFLKHSLKEKFSSFHRHFSILFQPCLEHNEPARGSRCCHSLPLGGSCFQRPGFAACSPRADAAVPLLPCSGLAAAVRTLPGIPSSAVLSTVISPGNGRLCVQGRMAVDIPAAVPAHTPVLSPNTASPAAAAACPEGPGYLLALSSAAPHVRTDFCCVQSLTGSLHIPAFPKHVKGYRVLLFAEG